MWDIRLKIANLVYSKMLHLHVTCEIQNQRQEGYCAYVDHIRLIPSRGCAECKSQFLTMPSLKFHLTQVYGWMLYQLFKSGSACWKHYPVSQPRVTLSVTKTKGSFRLIPSLTILCFESIDHVPLNIPNSHPLNPTLQFRRHCGSDPYDQQRTNPPTEGTS